MDGNSTVEPGQTPGASPQDDGDDSQWQTQSVGETPMTTDAGNVSGDAALKPTLPMQKRRRVTRACDECRRKKIKCDGKQPCTHCTVYSYECTYDQPSNRRRNPAPQYIEALEARLQKAESLLRAVLPSVDLDDPKISARGIDQILATAKRDSTPAAAMAEPKTPSAPPHGDDDAQLETMVQSAGSLDIDDNGDWDYHGHSSGYAFLHRLRATMGDSVPRQIPVRRRIPNPATGGTPVRPTSESPTDGHLYYVHELPPKEFARALCRNCLDDCCALMRFIHQPAFYEKLERIYSVDSDSYTNEDVKFLPLLYLVMAVGCLFSTPDDNRLDKDGYEKYIGQGYQYFNASRQMLDITDCRDLTALQTVLFMIIFLQATAKLSTCYAFIGIALRACLRLGLHRNVHGRFDLIEQEQRKRIFWTVRKMDSYVAAMLGLPQMLDDEDIDQELPTEVDDQYITRDALLPQPADQFPLLKGTNAHTRLLKILKKVVKYVYPINADKTQNNGYMISHARIQEIESDLQIWMEQLPIDLRPSDDASVDLARVQQLLRMSYAHVQMIMYRPFLHYVSRNCQSKNVDKRTFACAAACVSVARNIVHITSEMKKRGLLIGAYWFVMYTTYFAIVALVFFCLENPNSNTGTVILKDAMEGRDTLASLARRSLAADRCTQSLEPLFKNLPEKLAERKNSSTSHTSQAKKRPPPKASPDHTVTPGNRTSPDLSNAEEPIVGVQRSRTFPTDAAQKKRASTADPKRMTSNPTASPGYQPSPQGWTAGPPGENMTPNSQKSFNEQVQTSPQSATFDDPFGNPNLPDLKNVMFPSDDPFAYPNQPISSLERNQFTSAAPSTIINPYLPDTTQGNLHFDHMADPLYSSFPPFIPQHPQPQLSQQHFPSSNAATYESINPDAHITGILPQPHPHHPHPPEEFWSHLNSGQTALNPGVNLEDLFGNVQWNNWDNNAGVATGSGPAGYRM